jgi:hypothetical protein
MLNYVLLVFNIIVFSFIIYYLKQLETIGCKCALNFKHDYIFYFTIISLCYSIINVLGGHISIVKIARLIVGIPLFIGGIINIIFTIQYINDLREKKCECSESIIREGMYILAIINLCTMILLIIILTMLLSQNSAILNKFLLNYSTTGKFIKKKNL